MFREYFNYQSPSLLVKDLYEDNQNKNDIIVKYLNESVIEENPIISQYVIKLQNLISRISVPPFQKQLFTDVFHSRCF